MLSHRLGRITLVFGVFMALLTTSPLAEDAGLPPISGMALIEEREFLVVIDTKAGSGETRCGVLSVGEDGGSTFTPLDVAWPGTAANDLEGACPIPGRPLEFLVTESGAWTDRANGEVHAGRIFHLQLSNDGTVWNAAVLNTLPLDEQLHEVEGIACVAAPKGWRSYGGEAGYFTRIAPDTGFNEAYATDSGEAPPEFSAAPPGYETTAPAASAGGSATPSSAPPAAPLPTAEQWLIALGERGGGFAYEPAQLYTRCAGIDAGEWLGPALGREMVNPPGSYYRTAQPWLRGITDMYADPSGMLWIARAVDPGDGGPFMSYISRLRQLGAEQLYPSYMDYAGDDGWTLYGIKVEALGAPVLPGSVLSFATDDESYGGIWRPLGPH